MTLDQVIEELERRVLAGEVTFILKEVITVSCRPTFWVETTHPKFGLSPLEFLAEKKFLEEEPPYGLSWKDYHDMTDAILMHKGGNDSLRKKLIKVCKAEKKIRILSG